MPDHVTVRTGAYYDSVTMLQVSRQVAGTDGVSQAQVAMATELNVEVLVGMGFELPAGVAVNDVVVAVRGDDDEAVARGVQAAHDALAALATSGRSSTGFGAAPRPRTLGGVLGSTGTLGLVSVPGPHASLEALDAIGAGVSVMVFSDNVSVEDEVMLKDAAAKAGVLVMGPDCGTAVVGGDRKSVV